MKNWAQDIKEEFFEEEKLIKNILNQQDIYIENAKDDIE